MMPSRNNLADAAEKGRGERGFFFAVVLDFHIDFVCCLFHTYNKVSCSVQLGYLGFLSKPFSLSKQAINNNARKTSEERKMRKGGISENYSYLCIESLTTK